MSDEDIEVFYPKDFDEVERHNYELSENDKSFARRKREFYTTYQGKFSKLITRDDEFLKKGYEIMSDREIMMSHYREEVFRHIETKNFIERLQKAHERTRDSQLHIGSAIA